MFMMALKILNLAFQFALGTIATIANIIFLFIAIKYKMIFQNFANFAISQICFASLIFTIGNVLETIEGLFPFVNHIYSQNDLNKCATFIMAYLFGYQMRDSTAIFIQLNKFIALKWPLFFRKTRLKGKIILTLLVTSSYALGTIVFILLDCGNYTSPTKCNLPSILGYTNVVIVNSLGILVSMITILIKISCIILSKSIQNPNSIVKIVPTVTINSAPVPKKVKEKTFTDNVAKAMFFDFLNYIFLWTLPQLIYLTLFVSNANSEIVNFSNNFQKYCLLLNSTLNVIIFVATISQWRKLLINILVKKRIFKCIFSKVEV